MPHHRLFDANRRPHWYVRVDLSSGKLRRWWPIWIKDYDATVPHPVEIGPIGARWMQ